MTKKLRILVADDHAVVRAGVRSLLERQPNCEVCGEAVTGREAVTLAQQLIPDVVVLDITMPELDGLEAARQILKTVPNVQVLILSVHESEQLVREILNTGAHGFVLKSDAGRELAAAMQSFSRREPFFTSKVAQLVLRAQLNKEHSEQAPATPGDGLTPREREVLQLLAAGKSNKEVAVALGISVQTVETHRSNIMHKLGLHSVAELVHFALRHKLITL
jgi:DNA-binding NarL/FixJ family response regulator